MTHSSMENIENSGTLVVHEFGNLQLLNKLGINLRIGRLDL